MAQIIKHRRGQLTGVKDLTARNAEFIIASGSISDLNGPFVFIGSPNGTDEGVAGAFKSVSKMYQGTNAPTIVAGTYGSILDGTPFYASGNESLYILNNDGGGGNTRLDLTGNIEGNLISGVTINNLTGTTANIRNISGSFTGSGIGLYDIPASGITGLELNRISEGSATASISQAGGLRVNVNTEITGALIVTGNITGSNLLLTGDAKIDGNITLGGNITVGDASTDFVTFGAEISSSIVPDVHNAFDLGSSDKNWRNLHISGTAYVDTLEAQQVNFNDLGILTDLTVSGSTYLGNGGDITVISGSVYNDQLTEKRLVVVGAQGLLTDYSGITFDNGNLNVSGAIEVTNIQGTGSLYLKPDLNDSRDFRIYNTDPSDIHIKGNAAYSFFGDDTNYLKIDDSLSAITINSVSGVSINTNKTMVTGSLYNDQLTDNRVLVAGPNGLVGDSQYFTYDEVTLRAGGFEVDIMSGNTRMSGSLLVKSGATITGSFNLNDSATNFSIVGNGFSQTYFQGNGALVWNPGYGGVEVVGDNANLKINNTLNVVNGAGITGSLGVSGSAQFTSTINVDGEATLASATIEDLTQDRIVTVGSGGSLIDSSGFTYNGTVFQIGGGNFEVDTNDGDIRTSGSLTVEGGQTINGDVTVNGVLTVTGNTQLGANLYVSGNLEVLGSATEVHIQSQVVEIDDNIIRLNAYSPFQRYAGFEVIDSGSSGVSASMVWDSLNDYWMFVSASGQSSKLIGTTAGTYGSEINLTSGTFPIASGNNTIGDSLLTYSGTTLAFNTNKFTIDSSNGDTMVSGNFTLSYSGGTDNGTKTSGIMFRNSSNVVGYVPTTETTDVLDGILGYKHSGGGLVFSTVIDGGTY
jgi:hypothetical protein